MARHLTADDAKESLTAHVAAKGAEVLAKYGPALGWAELQRLLLDRTVVRYPCEIRFDAAGLNPGEFAHPVPKGDRPEDGFTMHVHPLLLLDLPHVAHVVLYELVLVNYGPFASADDAEVFGASALGLSRDEYYATLCAIADRVGGADESSDAPASGATGACGCGH